MTVVSVTATGHPFYGLCASQTVQSVLDHTPFEVIVGCDGANAALLPRSPRVRVVPIAHLDEHRADPFLSKFDVWRACLEVSDDEMFLHLDADAVVVAPLDDADLRTALGDKHLAMVEQTSIAGSTMDRASFLDHHLEHSHRYLVPRLPEPELEAFRFHNSGVIVILRTELRNLVEWYDGLRADRPAHHTVGEHMIADQDYLQVWSNTVRPGACADLDPMWNHCPWWSDDYPSPDARIVHLSNFCAGPPLRTALALQQLRQGNSGAAQEAQCHDLSFCVVTHRSAEVIGDCVDALAQFEGAEIVVVDNASDDDTIAVLAERALTAHCEPTNLGFAAGANRAAALATRPVLVFVNPDCFVHLAALDGVVDHLDANPDTILVADCVHEDGRVIAGVRPGYTAARLTLDLTEATPMRHLVPRVESLTAIDDPSWSWPLGTCLAMRSEAFDALGGFDETYFVYMEDVELGRRAYDAGLTIDSLPTAVVHLGARGARVDDGTRSRLLADARITYARRHHGAAIANLLRAFTRVGDAIDVARRRVRAR